MRSIVYLLLVTPFVAAQRQDADLEWQKHHSKIEYNVVGLGKHKLDELQTGGNWRMGQNSASLLKTECALIVADDVVVPGSYRVGVHRSSEKEFALMIEGGSLGASPQGGPTPVYAKGDLGKPEKPTKALEVTFKAEGKAANTVQPAKVTVNYGENQLTAGMSLVGTNTKKSGGWTVDGFSLPADFVEKRLTDNKPIPVAAFKKETGKKDNPFHVWNLVVTKDSAELWPAPAGPTDAFSEVKGLVAASMVKATSVKWEEAKDPKAALEVAKLEVAKGKGAILTLAVGKQTCTIALPEPKTPD